MKKIIFITFCLLWSLVGLSQTSVKKGLEVGTTSTGIVVLSNEELKAVDSTKTTMPIQRQLDKAKPISLQVNGGTTLTGDRDATLDFYTETEVDTKINHFVGVDSIRYSTSNKRFYYLAGDRWYSIQRDDSIAVASTLLTGLYGSWKLDEASGSVLDVLSLHSGTNVGGVANTATKFNKGYDMDTNTDRLDISLATNPPSSESRSISMWINFDILPSVAARSYTISAEFTSTYAVKYTVAVNVANTITLTVQNTESAAFSYFSAVGVIAANSTWYNVIFVLPAVGELGKIYVNGVLSSSASPTALTGTSRTTNFKFYVGGSEGQSTSMDGKVDDVGYWNRAITATEAAYIYNSGTGRIHPYSAW